jgi:hypothetical protein
MKLVLLASFKHVLSRRHICEHHLITLLQLSMSFEPHIAAQHYKSLTFCTLNTDP